MTGIDDYLELTPACARSQWQSVLKRQPVNVGRQVDFVPVETLLCLAATLVVNHRKYGSRTAPNAEEPVPSLARLFARPNSSVLAKMANLDGSRPNGAKHERAVASLLLEDPDRLAHSYRTVLSAARAEHIGEDQLPDFLDLEDPSASIELIGQEGIDPSEAGREAGTTVRRWLSQGYDLDPEITERLILATARVGQHRFATQVLMNHHESCVFCGLRVTALNGRAARMLTASHIKPWRACSPSERLDPANGLTACPTHDVAFDTGLLTVAHDLTVQVLPHLASATETDPSIRAVFGRPPLAARLQLPIGAVPPAPKYLTWHRTNVWQGG